jgi:hypothetical protein
MIIQGTAIKGMTVSSSAAGITSDSYFNLVSLLLPGNGTNGAQNNTFLDSSASPLTVTRNGSVTQGAFSPFTFGSGTQTDGYYSGYFDGSGDYLSSTLTASAPGTGSFTYECWFYISSLESAVGIFNTRSGDSTDGFDVNVSTSNQLQITYTGSVLGSVSGIIANQWNHLAIVRNGSTNWTVYINGNVGTTISNSTNFTSTTMLVGAVALGGSSFNGYISNFRYVTSAVYTSSFTPTTSPLTAITGTKFLTCQSSRFTDNSTNAFAITVNGNSQPSLTNPFNVTNQPVQAWSNYFDGSGDNLTVADNAAFEFGSGSFTVEMWFYLGASGNNALVTKNRSGTGADGGLTIDVSTTTIRVYIDGNASTTLVSNVSTTISLNTWYHLAVVRSVSGGTNNYVFLNGVAVGTSTTSTAFADNSQPLKIGTDNLSGSNYNQFTGYISNLRIVKGTAVYTSAFTPPTAPLTAVSGTSLLTCQSNRFIDNSTNAFAITRAGDTSVQPFSPFDPTAAYSTSSIGASMYFDGASKLTTSASIDISGVFTIESWFNSTNTGGWFFTIGNFPVYIDVSAGTVTLDKSSVGNQLVTTANEQVKGSNCWKHLAITRDGSGLIRVFVNGVFLGSVSTSYSAGTLNGLGQYASYGGAWLGYACDFRVVVGTALYTSAFTPPTAPLTAVSGTAILLSGINAGIYDAAAKSDWQTIGDSQISTAQSKFGGSSIYFDGSGDALANLNSGQYNLFDFGTGDFTIEFWFYCINTTSGMVYTRAVSGHNLCAVFVGANATDRVSFFATASGGGTAIQSAGTPAVSTWNHAAIVRQNGTVTVYLNGTGGTPTSNTTDITAGSTYGSYVPTIGAYYHGGISYPFAGYIDDFRITKGYARYTANFTPPTAAFPTQ